MDRLNTFWDWWIQVDKMDFALIRLLKKGVPLESEPYQIIGRQLGIPEEEVLTRIEQLKKLGAIQKISAAISTKNLGITENSMTVWKVPVERVQEVGRKMAQFSEVSHCVQRPTIPGKWPFNLYCMLHQPTREACEEIAKRISDEVGITDYWLCFSTKEYKAIK
jgi:DNA-binding Lrp family transcriptional regulator